ncbi:MAG: hypothetical protein QM484_00850 [Woeseiaceae bacterium]
MSELDIKKWLSNITETVEIKDLDKHMNLVSKSVMVYGLPNNQIINYSAWNERRSNEFKQNLLKSLRYDNLQVKNYGLRRLIFTIEEAMEGSNGDLVIINKQIVLEQEDDDQWRVVEETIKNWKYVKASQSN